MNDLEDMIVKKPKRINQEIWYQHKQWMALVREGALTGVSQKRNKNQVSTKNVKDQLDRNKFAWPKMN